MLMILVIDDSPTSRAIVTRLIGDIYEIRTASSGPEGIAAAEAGDFDLILLDLLMPGMDGKAVIAELASRGSRLPIVVMTADIQDTTRSRIAALGVANLLNKPLTRERLVSAITAAFGEARGTRHEP